MADGAPYMGSATSRGLLIGLAAGVAVAGALLATTQGNYALANVIQSNMDLYRRSLPLRDSRD